MMGLSLPPAATVNDALSLVNAMLDPARAKAMLGQIKAETDKHNKARDEAVATQKAADKAIATADARAKQLDQRQAELNERDAAITAREQSHAEMRAMLRARLPSDLLTPPPRPAA